MSALGLPRMDWTTGQSVRGLLWDIVLMKEVYVQLNPELERKSVCFWDPSPDGGFFDSSCGEAFHFADGIEKDARYRYCPGCGKSIVERSPSHTDVLKALATALPFHDLYVELGVQSGATFNALAPLFSQAIGVDIAIAHAPPRFYSCRTDEFFAVHKQGLAQKADLVFVDADHSAEQVQRDLRNSLGIIKPLSGLVVLHDTYPANQDELKPQFCNDAWRVAAAVRQWQYVEAVTLPGFHGLTVCRSVPEGKHLHWRDTDDLISRPSPFADEQTTAEAGTAGIKPSRLHEQQTTA